MYQGEGNVKLRFKVNNPTINISTWTCTMIVTRPDTGGTSVYSLIASLDGTEATFITTGVEFPVSGAYIVDFHALAPAASAPNKARVQINVLPAN